MVLGTHQHKVVVTQLKPQILLMLRVKTSPKVLLRMVLCVKFPNKILMSVVLVEEKELPLSRIQKKEKSRTMCHVGSNKDNGRLLSAWR